MARKPDDLWNLHSLVDSYVKASQKLCLALVHKRIDQAAVLKLIAAIQPHGKIRKLKAYYFFGVAYIAAHDANIALNPLLANRHHRLVRHADGFHERLQELRPEHAAKFDWQKAATIAREFREGFAQYTLPQLKAEVEAACQLMTASCSRTRPGPQRKDRAQPAGESMSVPELAREWRCGPGKIYTLIRNGELRAINMSTGPGARPRYRIHRSDAERCLQTRAVPAVAVPHTGRRRGRQSEGITEYF